MTEPLPKSQERDLGIDRCKGLLILLVVFGHLVSGTNLAEVPTGYHWYADALRAIYFFHMPAFLYLSGLISYRSLVRVDGSRMSGFITARADRLLVPFFAMGILITLGKIAATTVIGRDSISGLVGSGILDSLASLFWQTSQSPSRSIWFLFCYFVFLVVSLPFVRSKLSLGILLAVALAIYAIGLPPILYANKMSAHFVFFVLGLCSAAWLDLEHRFERFGLFILTTLAIASFAIVRLDGFPKAVVLVYGCLMGPILIQLCRASNDRFLLFLGRNTMAIYILNTIIIGVVSALSLRLTGNDRAIWMASLLGIALPAALLVPVLVKQLAILLLPRIGRYLA